MVEGVRKYFHSIAKRVCVPRMICEGSNFVPKVEQQLGGVFACVAERARDDDRVTSRILSLHRWPRYFSHSGAAWKGQGC
jgi:hypothetical protein